MYDPSVSVRSYVIGSAFWNTTGSNVSRIGVWCHELLHQFGLPDLYDMNTDSIRHGSGLGNYCLMANLWGVDFSQRYPPVLSAWSRIQLGWATPIIINSSDIYTLDSNTVYMITQGYPSGEYLLIENRPAIGYDVKLQGGGIAIYHIDEHTEAWDHQGAPPDINGWPWNHYRIALLQADGRYDLELTNIRGDSGDLYKPGQSLTPFTVPNTNTYQFGIVRYTYLYINIVTSNSFKIYWNKTSTSTSSSIPTSSILPTPTTIPPPPPSSTPYPYTPTTIPPPPPSSTPSPSTIFYTPTIIVTLPPTTTTIISTLTVRQTKTTVILPTTTVILPTTTITIQQTKTVILPTTTITIQQTKTVILPTTTITIQQTKTVILPTTTITIRPTKTIILPTTTKQIIQPTTRESYDFFKNF